MPDSWDFNQTEPQEADHFPVITYLIMFLCLVFTAAAMTGSGAGAGPWHRLYVLTLVGTPENVWAGRFWVMLTTVLVHGGILHIFCNMSVLYQLGPLMERKMSPLAYIGFMIAAALVSSSCEMMWTNGDDLGIGFSGVLYAMFGFAWMGRFRHPSWQSIANDRNVRFILLLALGFWIATDLKWLNIANGAHFGGFVFGGSLGWLVYGKRLRYLAALPTAAIVAIAVIGSTWMPWSGNWLTFKAGQAFDRGNYNTAIAYYHKCVRRNIDPAGSWDNISRAWHNLGVEAYYKKNYAAMDFDSRKESDATGQSEKAQQNGNATASVK